MSGDTADCEKRKHEMTLRERCEKVFNNCMGVPDGQEWKQIEAFAREIRLEALEEAAKVADDILNNLQAEDERGDVVTAQKDTAETIRNCIALRTHALAANANSEGVENG